MPAPPSSPPLPTYSQVNWGRTTAAAFALPLTTSLSGLPKYTNFDNNTNTANHPSLFAGYEWSSTASPSHTFPLGDTRRLSTRYADGFSSYSQMSLASLSGTLQGSAPPAPNRTDAGNQARMNTTTFSATLDVPMVPPVTLDYGVTTSFQLSSTLGTDPAATILHPADTTLPPVLTTVGQTPGTVSDMDNATKFWANRMAALGGVDLNRKLTDYRDTTVAANLTKGLAPDNVANNLQAWADRHNLARDIYARLVVATGANAVVNVTTAGTLGSVKVGSTATAKQIEGLRYLAQLAVNIVDQIDGDDVSTAFVWNPVEDLSGTVPAGTPGPFEVVTVTPATLTNATFQHNFNSDSAIQNGVVFGTEKPRLVLNEAYSETANDPADTFDLHPAAMGNPAYGARLPVHSRFWIELMNPGTDPYPGSVAKGPLGDGSVQLAYDTSDVAAPPAGFAPYSPYQVLIVRDGKSARQPGHEGTSQARQHAG